MPPRADATIGFKPENTKLHFLDAKPTEEIEENFPTELNRIDRVAKKSLENTAVPLLVPFFNLMPQKNPSLSDRKILPTEGNIAVSTAARRILTRGKPPIHLMNLFAPEKNENTSEQEPFDSPIPEPITAELPSKKPTDPRPEIELMRTYLEWDNHTHNKGLTAIKQGQEYFHQLENLKNIWQKIQEMLEDLPEEYTFPEELEPAFKVAEEMGLVEKSEVRKFNKKEIKILKAKIDAEMDILPQKGTIAFGRVTKLLDLSNMIFKVVSEAYRDITTLVRHATDRARAG